MILNHVRRMGRLKGMQESKPNPLRSMEPAVNLFGERAADPFDLAELVHARRFDAFEAAEAREQALTPLGADSADFLQCRRVPCLGAPCPVPRDGETMRFVAYLLNEVQCRMIRR